MEDVFVKCLESSVYDYITKEFRFLAGKEYKVLSLSDTSVILYDKDDIVVSLDHSAAAQTFDLMEARMKTEQAAKKDNPVFVTINYR